VPNSRFPPNALHQFVRLSRQSPCCQRSFAEGVSQTCRRCALWRRGVREEAVGGGRGGAPPVEPGPPQIRPLPAQRCAGRHGRRPRPRSQPLRVSPPPPAAPPPPPPPGGGAAPPTPPTHPDPLLLSIVFFAVHRVHTRLSRLLWSAQDPYMARGLMPDAAHANSFSI